MGLLDGTFRDVVAPLMVGLFTDDPLVFDRIDRVYNPITGVSVDTPTTVELKASPPIQWTEQELRDDSTRHSQLKVYVDQLSVDASGFDLRPGTESQVFCTRGGIQYKVNPVKRFASGDQDALLSLGLEK